MKKREAYKLWVGMLIGTTSMENTVEVPRKIKNRATAWPSNPFSGYLSENLRTFICKDLCIPMFISALFTIAKTWKQLVFQPTDDWIKMWYIMTVKYYSAIRKDGKLSFVDPKCITLSVIAQMGKDKNHIISLLCGI